MFNNVSCESFHKNINNLINTCELPPVVAYYILKDCLSDLEKMCNEVLEYQASKLKQGKKENQQTIKIIDQKTEKQIQKINNTVLLEEA